MVKSIIIPIILAAISSTTVGFLWYAIFLKKDSGVIDEEAIENEFFKNSRNISVASFLANIFSAAAVYMLIGTFSIQSFSAGGRIILAIWLILSFISGIKKVLIEKKSLENFFLGAGHDFAVILATFGVLIFLK